ncbi:conserved hypothetical protein [Halomonas sp. A3H3]|nr:conserved hypothetical protein [Halomonas sp. A3H3]
MQALHAYCTAGRSAMDGMTWFLIGMLSGVFITVACSAIAFSKAVNDLNEQGEQFDDWQ